MPRRRVAGLSSTCETDGQTAAAAEGGLRGPWARTGSLASLQGGARIEATFNIFLLR